MAGAADGDDVGDSKQLTKELSQSPVSTPGANSIAGSTAMNHSGLTSSLRSKLNFRDEKQWKKFSARRLELIHNLSLSSRKASEQDEEIYVVANSLREEYGFPMESLPDFDKLVRAGIQSVRRNKKRSQLALMKGKPTDSELVFVPQKRQSASTSNEDLSKQRLSPPVPRSKVIHDPAQTALDQAAQQRDDDDASNSHNGARISITNLVAPTAMQSEDVKHSRNPSPPPASASRQGQTSYTLPSISKLNLSSNYPSSRNFSYSLERLLSYVTRVPSVQGTGNTEYLGMSVMNAAAAFAVDKKFPGQESSERVQVRIQSFAINSALARSLGCPSLSSLKLALASACREFGFDAVIHTLSSVYYELMDSDPSFDFSLASTFERMAAMFPMLEASGSTLSGTESHASLQMTGQYPSAPPSSASTISTNVPGAGKYSIRPATVRYQDRKLDFTYDPGKNTPPTLAEVIEDGRRAFQINSDKILRVRNANLREAFLETDNDVADMFSRARIDLEFIPAGSLEPTNTRTMPKPITRFQQLL